MQCTYTLGGEVVLAYTNPSLTLVEPIPFQTSNRLKCPRQREETPSHIKWSDSHHNNPLSSSIVSIDREFHPKAQERADTNTATMKASILSTIAACLLPMASIAAPSEGAPDLVKQEYAFHGSLTAKVSIQAGVLIALFIQLSKSIFNAAHHRGQFNILACTVSTPNFMAPLYSGCHRLAV